MAFWNTWWSRGNGKAAAQVVAPVVAASPVVARPRAMAQSYEAGVPTTSRRGAGWSAPTTSGFTITQGIKTIRDRSRAAWRNDAYARGGLERLVTMVQGTGIKPLSKSPSPEYRRQVHAAWTAWTDAAGAGFTKDFYGCITGAIREWLCSGEAWIRLRQRRPEDNIPSAPLQIEVLPAEAVAEDYTTTLPNGNTVQQGVELNKIGAVVGYHVRKLDPQSGLPTGETSFVPADEMLHLYREEFPKQVRGVPVLSGVLTRLRELDVYLDASLVRAQLSAMFVAFLKGSPVEGSVDPLTGEAATTDADGRPMLRLAPGAFQELEPGEEVQFSDPPSVDGANFDAFVKAQLTSVAAGLGMSYSQLTGDAANLTDRVLRVQRQDFERHVGMLVHQCVAPVLQGIFSAWYAAALEAGTLRAPSADPQHALVEWIPEAMPFYHAEQAMAAAEAALRLGLTSRSALAAERGLDVEDLDAAIAADNKRADAAGLKFDGDARYDAKAKAPAAGGAA